MNKKKNESLVLEILERYRETRSDDYKLYLVVLHRLGINTKMSLQEFYLNYKKYKAPSFKTIERNRRHIQKIRQDLVDCKTAVFRAKEQEDYIDYNRSGINS